MAIRERLERAQKEGDLPPAASPVDLARYLSALIFGMAVLSAGGADRRSLQRVADTALRKWPYEREA